MGAIFLPFLYPGIISSDSFTSIRQAVGDIPLNNKHPVAFTALVSIFIWISSVLGGSIELGIAFFSLFQLIVLAMSCAFCSYWIYTRVAPKYGKIAVLFFAFNPLLWRYAVTMWKDVLFGAGILTLVVLLFEIVRTEGNYLRRPKNSAVLIAISLFICVFRSNGFAVLASLFVLLFFGSRFRRCFFCVVTGLICGLLIVGPVYSALDIQKTPFRESIGLPLQQLGRVYICDGNLSENDLKVLDGIWVKDELSERYSPKTVDPAKTFSAEQEDYLEKNKALVMSIWLESFQKNKLDYLRAWRDLTLGYWYPGITSWVSLSPGYAIDEDHLITEQYEIKSYGALIDTPLGRVFSTTKFLDTIRTFPSPFFPLFNIATICWLVVVALSFKLISKEYEGIIPLLPLLGIWLPLLLTAPTNCEFRYVFGIFLSLPLVLVVLGGRISFKCSSKDTPLEV